MSVATNRIVTAVVLAAGSASRFGSTKQLSEFAGAPLVSRALQTARDSGVLATTLVVGHDWQRVCDTLPPCDGFLVRNENFANGIGTSLALAVRATRHATDAILVLLADQPLITSRHLDNLIATWSGVDNEIIASTFAGVSGPPALFASGCFDDLAELDGDSGARSLLQNPRFEVIEVKFADAATDIDVPADLSRLQRSARS